MNRRPRWFSLFALLVILAPGVARGVPNQIPYRGSLTTEDGSPVNTPVTLEVALYSEADGGAPVWGPVVYPDVPVQSGELSLILGAPPGEPVTPEVFAGETLWLDFVVDGQPLEPRQRILSVPFALTAGDAEQLGGVAAEEFLTFADIDTDVLVRNHQVGEAARTNQYEDLDGLPDLNGLLRSDGTVALQSPWEMGGQPVTGLVIGGGDELPEAASSGALWFDSLTGTLAVHDGQHWRLLDDVAKEVTCSGCVELEALGFQLSQVAQTGAWADLEGAPLLTDYLRTDGTSSMKGDLDLGGNALVGARIEAVPTSEALIPLEGRLVLNQNEGRLEMGDGSQWLPVSGALNADGSLTVAAATIGEELQVTGALLLGGVNLGETVNTLENEVALVNTALETAEANLWCLTHCAPSTHPCHELTCDGSAETCVIGGSTNDNDPCGGGP